MKKEPLKLLELSLPPYTELELTYKEMETKQKVRVPLKEALGSIAAETIIPYPPGIPFIMEGEPLTEEKVEALLAMKKSGVRFQSEKDVFVSGIKIFER